MLNTVKPELNPLRLSFGIQAIDPLTGDTQIPRYSVQQYPAKLSQVGFYKMLAISEGPYWASRVNT